MQTFPITAKITTTQGLRTVRRNAETGIEIWSGERGLGDRVMVPSRIDPSGMVLNFRAYRNLAAARKVAAERAADMLLLINMAHGEAMDD